MPFIIIVDTMNYLFLNWSVFFLIVIQATANQSQTDDNVVASDSDSLSRYVFGPLMYLANMNEEKAIKRQSGGSYVFNTKVPDLSGSKNNTNASNGQDDALSRATLILLIVLFCVYVVTLIISLATCYIAYRRNRFSW